MHLSAVPLGAGDRPLGVAAFVADVSEVHRIESVRRDFVANVSHELKTPIGALEVLAETLVAEDDPAVTRPLAERIVKEAERLARIVDDLLDLSLIETQEAPRRSPTPLEVLVDDAVDQLRPAAAAAGINLQVHPGVTGALVACDRRQVVSAIANLIDNAVKYSEPGSPVTVSTALDRRRGRGRGARRGHRHPEPRPRADLRALLPGRPGAQPRHRRHRPRARHRAPRRARPRRRHHRRVGRGAGFHVPLRAPAANPNRRRCRPNTRRSPDGAIA